MRASSPVLRYRSTAGSICIRRAALRSNFTCGSIGCGLDLYPAPQVVDRIWPLPDEGVRPASVIDDIYHSPVKRSMTIAGHHQSAPNRFDMLKAAADQRQLRADLPAAGVHMAGGRGDRAGGTCFSSSRFAFRRQPGDDQAHRGAQVGCHDFGAPVSPGTPWTMAVRPLVSICAPMRLSSGTCM
jgi:hypothetical protein